MRNTCLRSTTGNGILAAAILPAVVLAGAAALCAAEEGQPRSRTNERGDTLTLLDVSPRLPAELMIGKKLNVKFSYNFASGDECLIWVRPLKDGTTADGYGAHGSPRYARGSGEAEGWLTLHRPASIDQLRIRMVDADARSEAVVELVVPAEARWTTSANTTAAPPANRPEIQRLVASGWKASWSPSGRRLVYGKAAGSGLQILDVGTGQVRDLVPSGKDAAWSPDGKQIAYVKEPAFNRYREEEVWLVTPAGEHARKLADGGFPGWSADSRRVYVHSRRENRIYAVDVNTEDPTPTLFFEKPLSWYPAVSPDGSRIAFGTPGALVIMERETGSQVLKLPTPGARGLLPAWSADGKHVAFGSFGTDLGLWVVDIQTEQARRIVPGHYTMPAWSADGSKLAFDLRLPEGNQVWMVNTDLLRDIPPTRPAATASRPRTPARASQAERGFSIGTMAPEIEGHAIDGEPLKLSDYRGQVVVLDFWGDW